MPEGNHRVELLHNTPIMSEHIIIHIHGGKHIPLLIHMVDNLEFLATLITAFKSIVDNITLEPVRIIKNNFLFAVIVVDLIVEEISLIQL